MISTLRRSARLVLRTVRLTPSLSRAFSTSAQPEHHNFKAETRRLLDIVINSLYTDKEVFIRELISNASDALEKLRFLQTTQKVSTSDVASPLAITLSVDPSTRRLIIEDSGVGMSKEELISNLGTIAKSATAEFVAQAAASHGSSGLIGRFGVGFYSSFTVADRVEVLSRSAMDAGVTRWTSDGHGEFTIETVPQSSLSQTSGTRIVLHLKEDCKRFAETDVIQGLVEKFSGFVDYPVYLKSGTVGEAEEGTAVKINVQEPLYTKTSATPEEHVAFYQHLTASAYAEPHYSLLYHTDAPLAIKAALYIVKEANDVAGTPAASKAAPSEGLALYSRRVLVQKHAKELVPSWMGVWLRGAVDCEDSLGLNVSREHMQDTRLMKKLGEALVRKILRYLGDEGRRDPGKYAEFWRVWGAWLKQGLLEDARANNGGHKELIMKLLRFDILTPLRGEATNETSREAVSLEDFADSIPEGQPIYYVVAVSKSSAAKSPFLERLGEVNALVFTEEIDEYLANYVGLVKGRRLVNVAAGEHQAEPATENETKTKLENLVKSVLNEHLVDKIVLSEKLKSSPAVVTSQISPNMRKMMKQMMRDSGAQPDMTEAGLLDGIPVTLELNASHPVVERILALSEMNEAPANETAKIAVKQLFHNALISAGLIDNPQLLLQDLNKLLEVLVKPKM
jgi:TNF receptor-associated protein 1